jgi:hypothetical protein
MGFDIEIGGARCLYHTYNHSDQLSRFGIHARSLNGKTAKEILPLYQKAEEELRKTASKMVVKNFHNDEFLRTIGDSLWNASDTSVWVAVKRGIKVLEDCHPDDVWQSD